MGGWAVLIVTNPPRRKNLLNPGNRFFVPTKNFQSIVARRRLLKYGETFAPLST
jgi:hypothetical protein